VKKISCIVVSYNVKHHLEACLASLKAAQADEVIVVDNASPDGSAMVVKTQFPDVKLIALTQNLGFSAAVNAGANVASGELLLLLNPDAYLDTMSLPAMAQLLEERQEVVAVGFRQIDTHREFQLSFGLWPTVATELLRCVVQRRLDAKQLFLGRMLDRLLRQPQEVGFVAGSSLLVRRSAFDAIGGFDEGFFLYFEDIDFCMRLRVAGGRVFYDPRFTVMHHRGQSANTQSQLARQAYRRSQHYFWRKHGGLITSRLLPVYAKWRGA
jgi:GT2 family glycosyltransferase